ncbi:MAG: PEP-CTERM sorting domain-containing protein [Gemmatimonadota bacterium]
MKRHAKQIVLWAAFLLLPVSVDAQITDYTGSLGTTEYLNFVGAGGDAEVSSWSEDGSRYYVGPYVGEFQTGGVTSPRFSLICVDFDHYAGDQEVDVTGLGSGQTDAGLGATRLGDASGSLSTYRQAAYLGSLMDSWADHGPDRPTVFSGLHAAIWTLMTGRDIGGSDYDYRDDFLALASLEAASFDTDGWYVLSAADGYDGQEMLIRTPASTVPEPSTYLLMATGLLFLVFFGRKRMRDLNEG